MEEDRNQEIEQLSRRVTDPEGSLTRRERRKIEKEVRKIGEEKSGSNKKNLKFFVWIIILAVLAFAGYKLFTSASASSESILATIELKETDNIKGNKEASVTLIEYGDFQCPACANYYPLLKDLNKDFPDDLKIVYRHFPLIQVHKNALSAAKASEAASKQGKFWEMHNLLFEKQEEWAEDGNAKDKFMSYAESLGLDIELFKSDFDSKQVQDRISDDMASGNNLKVNATPTFFLNGNKVSPRSYDEFKNLVDREIK